MRKRREQSRVYLCVAKRAKNVILDLFIKIIHLLVLLLLLSCCGCGCTPLYMCMFGLVIRAMLGFYNEYHLIYLFLKFFSFFFFFFFLLWCACVCMYVWWWWQCVRVRGVRAWFRVWVCMRVCVCEYACWLVLSMVWYFGYCFDFSSHF